MLHFFSKLVMNIVRKNQVTIINAKNEIYFFVNCMKKLLIVINGLKKINQWI